MNLPTSNRPAPKGPPRGQRVVPLPLAMAALSVPLLIAWSSDGGFRGAQAGDGIQGSQAEARPLDEPFVLLSRDVRLPDDPGGYVDIWAEPKGWEVGALLRAQGR